MGWYVGYTGDCPGCGASVHNLAKDKARMTALWLRCPDCLRATCEHVADEVLGAFWDEAHPCPECGTGREPWSASRCARCGQEGVGRYVCEPD